VPSRVVVAGLATRTGQKVHNLIQAVGAAGRQSVLAFVDSDAGADPDRLWRLVGRLRNDPLAVGSGYRWYRPIEPTLPNLALSALNNLVLLLAGPSSYNLIWGGAWAVRRETFEALGLPQGWEGALSDDLVASRLAQARGVKVAYDPNCLATSPADFTWAGVVEFVRRQYIILRINVPRWWWGGVFAGGAMLALLTAGPVLAALQWARGGNGTSPLLVSAAFYALTAWRAALQLRGIRPFVRAPREEVQRVERLNIWAWPLVIALNWVLLLSTAVGRTITWRGITYRIDGPQQTTILSRPSSTPARKAA
jgi:cellulose synthase/poly-beta-1,6-N-acetylglucosamine synthase-like glycosyltransferase